MSRAIANGVNVGQAGPAESIDIDAIAAACSRSEQRRCFGNDANADDDHVCGDSFSARQKDGRNTAIRLFQRLDHGPCAQIDAMSAMISIYRKSAVQGKRVTFSVDLGGRRYIQKKKK